LAPLEITTESIGHSSSRRILMNRPIVIAVSAIFLCGHFAPASLADTQPDLNFKIYSPDSGTQSAPASGGSLTPKSDDSINTPSAAPAAASSDSLWSTDAPAKGSAAAAGSTPAAQAAGSTPATAAAGSTPAAQAAGSTAATAAAAGGSTAAAQATAVTPPATQPEGGAAVSVGNAEAPATDPSASAALAAADHKALQGYIRVVPSGTKIPIIMDTAVDSDTSQEGDEFSARTGEDLNIDGNTVVPAGSIIKGRIAQLNAPKNLGRSGSVALKFDTVTTPDNRQIPLVANLVARGGVVHAKRGMKDIALDTTTLAVPLLIGAAIGLLAGSSSNSTTTTSSDGLTTGSSKINKGEAAMIGAGVGLAVGVAILLIKKGKKVDVRPGDELKIELAEDLRMPM
jgi:hypothetical protein